MEQHHKHNLLVFILVTFALEAILFSAGNFKSNLAFHQEEQRVERIKYDLDRAPILARAVSVYDITANKKIYGKNDNEPLPLASLVKTMTVIVSLGDSKEDEDISLSSESIKQAGDFGLFANENWNVKDLAQLALVVSANDGAYALAENSEQKNNENFLEKMNSKAKKIGMEHTVFLNYTGLDLDLERPGAFASAYDANMMAGYALRAQPEVFSATTLPEAKFKSLSGFEHTVQNTDIILDKIPNLLFSKTGYTELAGGNLSIIFKDKNGHDIAVTVLGSTYEERFSDMEQIVSILYNS